MTCMYKVKREIEFYKLTHMTLSKLIREQLHINLTKVRTKTFVTTSLITYICNTPHTHTQRPLFKTFTLTTQ